MSALSLVDPTRLQDWDDILSRTREMLDAANAGDWDRVVVLEAERRNEISRFFSAGIAAYETVHVRRGIQEILESDRELLSMSQRQKRQRSADIVQLRRRASVQKAYEATAAG
ncbi:MAG: flagellar protein FliT [Chromatiaceae bacterium]